MSYIGQQPVTGDNNSFRILDSISSYTQTFDGSSSAVVSTANSTLTFTGHRFITGQRVTYSTTGTTIGGLSSGSVYYVIKTDQNTLKLASSYVNALASTSITLTSLGVGSTHTLNVAFDSVNTKFKATFNNGTKGLITRAAQLNISINGVLQEPQDTTTPTDGFGIEADSTIVFSVAPAVGNTFWGSLVATNFATFDISDNTVDNFTGNASQTNFVLSKTPANNQNVLVTINGVVQYPSDATNIRAYSVSGNVLIFVDAPGSGSLIQVRHIGFAGATSSSVTGFYGRTGNVGLNTSDTVSIGAATIGVGGIGTSLLVQGNARITGILTIGTGSITLDGNANTISGVTQSNASNTNVTGIATFLNGPVLIGSGTSTGTASQRLQVTGGAYVSGNLGIGTAISNGPLEAVGGTGANFCGWFRTGDATSANNAGGGFYNTSSATATSRSATMALDADGANLSGGDYFLIQKNGNSGSVDILQYSNAAMRFGTNFISRGIYDMTLDSSGRFGIGTASPGNLLHLSTAGASYLQIQNTTAANSIYLGNSSGNGIIQVDGANSLNITINGSERARIDSSGRLLVGTSSARSDFYNSSVTDSRLQIEGNGSTSPGYILQSWIVNHNSATVTPHLVIGKSRGSTNGSVTIVQSGDSLGHLDWHGADGTDMVQAASIDCVVDGTPGNNDMPGRLVFSTTADGASVPTEAMRINNQRELLIGTTTRTANGGVLQVSNGITFPATQVACTDPNTLDDYEEGTWTPSVGGTATYSVQIGTYTKVGRQVTVSFDIGITTLGTGDTNRISGLPFGVAATGEGRGATGYFDSLAVNVIALTCYAANGDSRVYFNSINASGTTATQNPAIFGNSARVQGSVTYFTS